MDSNTSVKDTIKSFVKVVIRTTVLFIAILTILFFGMLLGQQETLYSSFYTVAEPDWQETANPNNTDHPAVVELDELKLMKVAPLLPVSPLEEVKELQHK